MKIKAILNITVILTGLAAVLAGAYFIGNWVQTASVAKHGISKGWIIGGGVAAVGGVTGIVLASKSNKSPS